MLLRLSGMVEINSFSSSFTIEEKRGSEKVYYLSKSMEPINRRVRLQSEFGQVVLLPSSVLRLIIWFTCQWYHCSDGSRSNFTAQERKEDTVNIELKKSMI